jgi:tetratricopeptide (TPR) repeat protein
MKLPAQWLAMSLQEFQELKPPHYRLHFVAAAHHGLGIVRILLGQFDAARDHLETAFSVWVQLENIYEQASLCNEMGYLEGQLGNIPEACEWLRRGMELCHTLPDMPSRCRLQALLDATLAELDDASLSSG